MIYECSSLTNIDLSNFNTNKVTNMACIFQRCSSPTNINLYNFIINNAAHIGRMFRGCK